MGNMTTTISVQINTKDKEEVGKILQKLGITLSGLINMTIKQTILKKKIPFEVSAEEEYEDDIEKFFTKKEIKEMMKEVKYIKKHIDEYPKYDNWEDLKEALLSDDDE